MDAGYVPNDMQVGQTGKIVAPVSYSFPEVAAGVHFIRAVTTVESKSMFADGGQLSTAAAPERTVVLLLANVCLPQCSIPGIQCDQGNCSGSFKRVSAPLCDPCRLL